MGRSSGDTVLSTDDDLNDHDSEMGTPEMHCTSILMKAIAPTTERSLHPGYSLKKARKRDGSKE